MSSLLALFRDPAVWAALVTLIAMEVVLAIDNLIFISVLTNRLPANSRKRARVVGISLALVLRLALLAAIAVIVSLTRPLFGFLGHGFSWRDLILIAGGGFLIWKATQEIHQRVAPAPAAGDPEPAGGNTGLGFGSAVGQIILLDLVFSIDSILTAVGMTTHVPIMFLAVILAVLVMLFAATPLADFIQANPTVVMLALAFLLMIGMALVAEGTGTHVPKGYIYAAMAFSALVEGLNAMAGNRARRGGGRRAAQ